MLSSDYESLIPSGTTPGNEGHFEAYYSINVNEHVSISPDVQVITNANADDNFKTVTIGAVRGQFTF